MERELMNAEQGSIKYYRDTKTKLIIYTRNLFVQSQLDKYNERYQSISEVEYKTAAAGSR